MVLKSMASRSSGHRSTKAQECQHAFRPFSRPHHMSIGIEFLAVNLLSTKDDVCMCIDSLTSTVSHICSDELS